MLWRDRTWRPTEVQRVVETLGTSTRPAKVITDAGPAFLKGMDNPQGNDTLACELVAGELARLVGLRTPDFGVLDLDLDIPMQGYGNMTRGPAFVSRVLSGLTGSEDASVLKKLATPGDISRLVMFDTWIRNADRWPPEGAHMTEPNFENLFFTPNDRKFEIIALDHSHCFVEGSLDDELTDPAVALDERVYGLFPSFRAYINEQVMLETAAALRAICEEEVVAIVSSVPNRWGPMQRTRDKWVDVILARAELVAAMAPEKLLVQGRLEL